MAESATAPTTTASVEPKKKIFGEQKKPDSIVYRLLKKNDRTIRTDTPDYPPYKRFPNTDIIVWDDGTREIRWLPGEQTIFVDEQEANGRKIPENILNNPNNRIEIIEGHIRVRPHEKTKIQFLDMCNRNSESKYRTGTVEALFKKFTEEDMVGELKVKQVKQKEAMDKAFAAEDQMIYDVAIKLNIPLINNLTQGSREYESIVADFRQTAMDSPEDFLKAYNEVAAKVK